MGLRIRLRWIRNRLLRPGGRGAILLYHRIADDPLEPYGSCVSPENFEKQLRVLTRRARPCRLRDLAESVRSGKVPDGSVALTFDDGYLDNLTQALPLLERYGVPATFFVTTGDAGRDREFWWDRLGHAVLGRSWSGECLEVTLGGQPFQWRLNDPVARGVTDSVRGTDATGRTAEAEAQSVQEILRELHAALLPLPPAEREQAVDRICSWAGRDPGWVREAYQAMDPSQVERVAAHPLIDVESHTHHHCALTHRPGSEQDEELGRSRETLEGWTGREVAGIAYPHGRFDDSVCERSARAGYRYGCSTRNEGVTQSSRIHALPRLYVGNGDVEAFERRLLWVLY